MDESELIPFKYLTDNEKADARYYFGANMAPWEIENASYHRRVEGERVTIDLVESATDH